MVLQVHVLIELALLFLRIIQIVVLLMMWPLPMITYVGFSFTCHDCMFIMIGANVTTNNDATSSIASPSSLVSTTPNIRSNLHVPSTQMTNTSSTHNNSPKSNCPNNLDVALQAFIQRFVPSDNTTIGQILQGISRNAESVQISNTS